MNQLESWYLLTHLYGIISHACVYFRRRYGRNRSNTALAKWRYSIFIHTFSTSEDIPHFIHTPSHSYLFYMWIHSFSFVPFLHPFITPHHHFVIARGRTKPSWKMRHEIDTPPSRNMTYDGTRLHIWPFRRAWLTSWRQFSDAFRSLRSANQLK